MFAIVNIAGQQMKVEQGKKVFVNRLDAKEGAHMTFDNVLLLADGDATKVGTPSVSGAKVEAKVVRHLKADKVIIFKKKRRKGFQKKQGHRQSLTQLEINNIVG